MEQEVKDNDIWLSIPGVFVIVGPTREGKSTLIEYVMFKYRERFHYGISESGTAFKSENLRFIPEVFRHQGHDEEMLIAFMNKREELVARGVKAEEYPAFLVIEDMASESTLWGSPTLLKLSTNTSHYGVFIILSTQYPQKIPGAIREQIFQVAIFHLKGVLAKQNTYEAYGENDFETYALFRNNILKKLPTKSYKFAFYDDFHSEKGWRILKCPHPDSIPHWQFDFGQVSGKGTDGNQTQKRKRSSSNKRRNTKRQKLDTIIKSVQEKTNAHL
jgi:hypothetical protein